MSEDHVPAWKRAGLATKQKKTDSYDPLTAGLKRSADDKSSAGPKKPPKRQKLPKAERKPPPESDQLAYLKQFHGDKQNWKFSKQKQNWILKNLFTIEKQYEPALVSYVTSIQGASRQRAVEEAQQVVDKWNKYMGDSKDKDDSEKEDDEQDAKPKSILKNAKEPPKETPPSEKMARRAGVLIKAFTGEDANLEYLSDDSDSEDEAEDKDEVNDEANDEANDENSSSNEAQAEDKHEEPETSEDPEISEDKPDSEPEKSKDPNAKSKSSKSKSKSSKSKSKSKSSKSST